MNHKMKKSCVAIQPSKCRLHICFHIYNDLDIDIEMSKQAWIFSFKQGGGFLVIGTHVITNKMLVHRLYTRGELHYKDHSKLTPVCYYHQPTVFWSQISRILLAI